jgi:hypothetical protein
MNFNSDELSEVFFALFLLIVVGLILLWLLILLFSNA